MLITGVPDVFWWCMTPVVATVVWMVVAFLPGERRRWIFQPRPVWLMCWLRGELSVPVTLLTGGPLVAGIGWWVYAMGCGPGGGWQWLLAGGWSLMLAVALLNAVRKSRAQGGLCTLMVALVTLLVPGRRGLSWQAVSVLLTS